MANSIERMKDKVVLVTGAGSGIGQATAIRLSLEGAKIIIADIDQPAGENTWKKIQQSGKEAILIKVDISKAKEVADMIARIVEKFNRIDCAVNNAGIDARFGDTVDKTEEIDFDRVINVNVKGTWLCMKYELLQMHKQGWGNIVNIASILGIVGAPNFSAYVASKHAIVGLTKSAALENARNGVRINAVCPSAIRTPLLDRALGVDWSTVQPMGRTGTVDEVANGVLWLCSKESSFTTGHTLFIDGGLAAG